jgi:hypothetical protein
MDMADPLLASQVAEMSCYSGDKEIASVCADFLVELRGFEPLTAAVNASRGRTFCRTPIGASR